MATETNSVENPEAAPLGDRTSDDPQFKIDTDGFEGPLDLLLELARRQKVDLTRISILDLADQYLEFIAEVRKLRIELAADYLVMAAWLAYLKSKLLVPSDKEEEDELSGEEMAALLAFRLKRLEAMRDAGNRLINRNRLGRDFFARGIPEPIEIEKRTNFSASLFDLLSAYTEERQRNFVTEVTIAKREVWSLQDARERILGKMLGLDDWTAIDDFLKPFVTDPEMKRSAVASTFAASLELVREGKLAMRQEKAFAPIFLRPGATRNAGQPRLKEVNHGADQ